MNAKELIAELVTSARGEGDGDGEDNDPASLQSEIMRLLEHHHHEAAQDVLGKFTAEKS